MTFDLEVIFQWNFFIPTYTWISSKLDGCNPFHLGLHRRSKEHKFVTLKVYNEVAIELCMACLKFIKKTQKPTEEILFRYFQDIFPPKPLPYLRCVKSLLKFSLILKGDLLTCIAMVQCDLDTTVGLLCPHSQSLTSTYNGERKRATNIFNSHFCTGAWAFRQDRQTVEPAEAATT